MPLTYSSARWDLVVGAHLCSRERDPFLDWLNALPAWDATPRLDSYLDELFNAGESPLVRWAGQFLFLGPVYRAEVDPDFRTSS